MCHMKYALRSNFSDRTHFDMLNATNAGIKPNEIAVDPSQLYIGGQRAVIVP